MNKKNTYILYPLLTILVILLGVVPTQALPTTGRAGTTQGEVAIDPGDWHQAHISLALDDDGTHYAVWQDYRDGTVPHIRFATRPADGSWGISIKVDTAGAGDQTYPAIGVDGAGNVWAVWQDERGSVPQIRYATRPAGGSWSASQVISPTAQAQYQPALAVNSSGVAVVAWRQGTYPVGEVFATIWPAGGPWGSAGLVNDASTGHQYAPAVDLDDAGQAYAVWTDERNGDRDVYFAARPAGGPWGTNERVDDDDSGQWQYEPDIAVAADGTAHAIWRDLRGGDWSIYHTTRPAGGPWSANARVNDDPTGGREQPDVAVDELGNALAVWLDSRNGTADLYGASRPPGGAWQANELLVPAPTTKNSISQETTPIADPLAKAFGALWSAVFSMGTPSHPYDQHNVYENLHPRVNEIHVTPNPMTLKVGESGQFTAKGYDQYGNEVPIAPVWSATGGSITTNGLYTPQTPGDHIVTASASGKQGSATVHVTAGDLDKIVVTPNPMTLKVGESGQFTAKGYDQYGNEVPISPVWSGTGGKFDDFKSSSMRASFARTGTQQATYTAGNLPGLYQVTATSGKVTGSAQVRITGPVPPDLAPGQSWNLTFFTEGIYPYYDRYNFGHQGTVVVNPVTASSEHNEGQNGNSFLAPFAAVTVPVTITAAGFDPPTITINVSDTVCWTNADTTVHAIRGGVPFKLFLPLVVKNYQP